VTPCPESTECVHRKHPDLCKSLGSTTCRFTRRSSLVHQCVVPVLVVLPMLRLRWALLNNPSCLMHRLDNRHCPSPCGPWSAVESRSIVFFWREFFCKSRVKKKEGRGGGGEILTETGNRNRKIRKQHLFPNFCETRSQNIKKKTIANTNHSFSHAIGQTLA